MQGGWKVPLIGVAIGSGLALAGFYLVLQAVPPEALHRWIAARRLVEVAWVLCLIPVTTLVHEGGHLAAGLVVGCRPLAIYIKPLLFERSKGWRVQLRWNHLPMGFVRMQVDATGKPGQALQIAGGAIANFASALVAACFLRFATDTATLLTVAWVLFSVIMGITNLMPLRFRSGLVSDGARLVDLFLGAEPGLGIAAGAVKETGRGRQNCG